MPAPSRRPTVRPPGEPWPSAAEAWLAAYTAQWRRRNGGKPPSPSLSEGTVDDVMIALDRAWKAGQLTLAHVLALKQAGEAYLHGEPEPDRGVLDQALAVLGQELARRGLCPPPPAPEPAP